MALKARGPTPVESGRLWSGAVGETGVPAGLVEGVVMGRPFTLRDTLTCDWAIVPVVFVSKVLVGLQALEIGKDAFEGPLVISPFNPSVVVLPNAPQEVNAVDPAGAAGNLPSGNVYASEISGPGAEIPNVVGVPYRCFAAVGEPDLVRDAFELGVISPGLKQENRAVGVLGESGGEGGARGARSYDDVVVFHRTGLVARQLPCLMKSATFSPIVITVTLRLARTVSGIMEASTSRRLSTP